jgi:hypothetical protein
LDRNCCNDSQAQELSQHPKTSLAASTDHQRCHDLECDLILQDLVVCRERFGHVRAEASMLSYFVVHTGDPPGLRASAKQAGIFNIVLVSYGIYSPLSMNDWEFMAHVVRSRSSSGDRKVNSVCTVANMEC